MEQQTPKQTIPYRKDFTYSRHTEEQPEHYTVEGANRGFSRFLSVRVGDVYNGYRVIRKLGWGSFSTVWLAEEMTFIDSLTYN